jgi:hypothetical protein
MEALIVLAFFVLVGLLAARFGVDSRRPNEYGWSFTRTR